MTIRVLIDRHHHALLESLLMLFEDRYGWECFIPYGMDWYDADIYVFERDYRKAHGWEPYDAVARQYLEGIWGDVMHATEIERPTLVVGKDGIKERRLGQTFPIIAAPDPRHPWRTHKGVTLDAARSMRWDIVLSSLPHNDPGMARFAKERGAKFGVQVGNESQQSAWDLADFILTSATMPGYGPEHAGRRFDWIGKPAVMYHQEFSLEVFRHEWPPTESKSVASFVNCFPETEPYGQFAALARAYGDEFDWRCYGAYGSAPLDELAAGDISLVSDVADRMRASRVIWHAKYWSDGFGHVIHNAFSVGRPVVGWPRYYRDKLAGPLWQEGVTSFDMERPLDEVIGILRRLRDDDDYHRTISENAARRFREVVDFDAEAATIRTMLEGVLS